MIEYRCGACGASMESPTSLAGQTELCPQCGSTTRVPTEARRASAPKPWPVWNLAVLAAGPALAVGALLGTIAALEHSQGEALRSQLGLALGRAEDAEGKLADDRHKFAISLLAQERHRTEDRREAEEARRRQEEESLYTSPLGQSITQAHLQAILGSMGAGMEPPKQPEKKPEAPRVVGNLLPEDSSKSNVRASSARTEDAGTALREAERRLAEAAARLAPAGDGPDLIESNIEGNFSGWKGGTIFKLSNGQIWQQVSYAYTYHYAFRPEVTIIKTSGAYKMVVEGVSGTIFVKRLQ